MTTTADKKDAEATQEKKRGLRPKKTVEADVVNADEKEAVAAIEEKNDKTAFLKKNIRFYIVKNV